MVNDCKAAVNEGKDDLYNASEDDEPMDNPTSKLVLWKGLLGSLLARTVTCLVATDRLDPSTPFWIWDSTQVETLLSILPFERPHGLLCPLLPLFITSGPSRLPP